MVSWSSLPVYRPTRPSNDDSQRRQRPDYPRDNGRGFHWKCFPEIEFASCRWARAPGAHQRPLPSRRCDHVPRASWQDVHQLRAQGFCHVVFGVRAVPECGQAVRSLGLWHSILTGQRRFDLHPARLSRLFTRRLDFVYTRSTDHPDSHVHVDDTTLAPLKGRVRIVDLAEVAQLRDVGHGDVAAHAGSQLRLNLLLCVATARHVVGLQLLC